MAFHFRRSNQPNEHATLYLQASLSYHNLCTHRNSLDTAPPVRFLQLPHPQCCDASEAPSLGKPQIIYSCSWSDLLLVTTSSLVYRRNTCECHKCQNRINSHVAQNLNSQSRNHWATTPTGTCSSVSLLIHAWAILSNDGHLAELHCAVRQSGPSDSTTNSAFIVPPSSSHSCSDTSFITHIKYKNTTGEAMASDPYSLLRRHTPGTYAYSGSHLFCSNKSTFRLCHSRYQWSFVLVLCRISNSDYTTLRLCLWRDKSIIRFPGTAYAQNDSDHNRGTLFVSTRNLC